MLGVSKMTHSKSKTSSVYAPNTPVNQDIASDLGKFQDINQ